MAACFMKNKDSSGCGEFRGHKSLTSLLECTSDISSHLKRCHLSKEKISEYQLILIRAGHFHLSEENMEEMFVCPRHRGNLGAYWKCPTSACQYPDHKGKQEAVKGDRVFNVQIAKDIFKIFGVTIPVGSPICNSCRKFHGSRLKTEWLWLRETQSTETDDIMEKTEQKLSRAAKEEARFAIESCISTPLAESRITNRDPAWSLGQWQEINPDSSSDDEFTEKERDVLKIYNEALSNIALLSGIAVVPLTFRLTSEWDEATKKEKELCTEQVGEACRAVCGVIAPKDSDKLLRSFQQSNNEMGYSDDLKALVTAYKQAPTRYIKVQILSIYATRYPAQYLKKIHEPFEKLSDRQIKKARAHAKNVGVGQTVEKPLCHRVKIDSVKLEHFLSFIDQPYFYQDVAYGTRTLKLDSGEELVMPNVIRIVARSTMVEQYLKHCSDDRFEPLGRSTLFRILQVREASQRKSLQGLDNIAAGGAEAFESVHKIVDDLKECGASATWCDEVQNGLKNGKRYLKTEYRVHCREEESLCPDHCRYFALSDLQDPELKQSCSHQHQVRCNECEHLKVTLQSIAAKIDSPSINFYSDEQKEDFKHDLAQARDMIFQWKSHILRAENQERAKQNVLSSLQDNSVMVVMDWAMKFLQLKYREKQSEWFGKRGMNWHVSCVISQNAADNSLQVESYVHLFDSCAQDWHTVCAILEHLLKIIKEKKPEVNQVFLRSDGAGCYHNNNLISATYDIGVRVGVKVIRYDFSEPQFGKDVCDRIISPMKGAIRRYCNEGHDITTASDMHEALKARQVKGTTAAVCQVFQTAQEIKVNRISNFSSFHNFSYEEEGLRISKAYGVGAGKLIPWSQLVIHNNGSTILKEVQSREFFPMLSRAIKPTPTDDEGTCDNPLFMCPESGCSIEFATSEELQDHIHFGQHDKKVGSESLYDNLRRDWAAKFLSVTLESKLSLSTGEATGCEQIGNEPCDLGWALQKPRGGGTRFSENVKSYLTAKFDLGEDTGRKADPAQVAADMRVARNSEGQRKFQRGEWLSKAQIQGFFSRLAASKRRKSLQKCGDDDHDGLVEDEMAYLTEKDRQMAVDEVVTEIGLIHPITYDGYDICELSKSDALAKFNVATLKAICVYLDLPFRVKDVKATLIYKLKEAVKECECRK